MISCNPRHPKWDPERCPESLHYSLGKYRATRGWRSEQDGPGETHPSRVSR